MEIRIRHTVHFSSIPFKCKADSEIYIHKVLMYIYRVQSSVWRGEGVGVNISEDARHWIGLLQYNPSTYISLG